MRRPRTGKPVGADRPGSGAPLVSAGLTGISQLRKKGGDPAARSRTATLLRLHPNHQPDARHLPPRGVGPAPSRLAGFRGVTGGVYKARERIHRTMLTRGY